MNTWIVAPAVAALALFIFIRAVKKNTAVWYPVPFKKGDAYVAVALVPGAFDTIEPGTVLVYESTAFSRYDGYIGFFFTDTEGKRRRWDISDSLNPESEAKQVFAVAKPPVPNPEGSN